VTNAIDRLESQGLVRRLPDEADRRRTFATLTDAGKDVLAVSTKALMAIDFAIDGLNPKEQSQTYELLRALRSSAGDFA
jgi:DNA-binding MarR family transcriptional regulator